jgi:hypothetical protein
MTHRLRLKLGSWTFAIIWTCGMLWHLSPIRPAEVGMLVVTGALAGVIWYWLYGAWYRWYLCRRLLPDKRPT